jgi:ATP/maltotriose-dependent transcriptional regulator MalT
LHRRHTPRPRLTQLLDSTTAQAILITAPAGYGKTSLACEWLADHPAVGWYRATPGSADLAAFSVGIADVLQAIVPGAGDRLSQRLRVAEAPEKAVRPLAELLAEDLADWPDPAWLVIDDYHLVIDSSPVEEFMDWLLTLAPVRVLVTTRRRPAWASARRILSGELFEISREQLAMTNEEAARVLDGKPGEAIRALVMEAQGWPAVIGLAALSVTAEIPSDRLSEGLFRYFAEEVFRREPPALQRFMLTASVPQVITSKLARDVLEVDNPQPLIERLLDEGLLQDSGSDEYSFHPLLRDFLRRKFDSEMPDLAVTLADKVLRNARETGRLDEAFDIAVGQHAFDEAAELVGEAAPVLLADGRIETLEKWFAACGSVLVEHPHAVLARAEVLMRRGRFSEAAGLARSVAHDLSNEHAAASYAWSLAGQAAHLLSDDHMALKLHLKALDVARTDTDKSRALWGAAVTAADLELDDAEYYLREFSDISLGDPDTRLRMAVGVMLNAERRGSLRGVFVDVGALLPLCDYSTDPMIKSSFLVQLSYVQSLRGRYAEALELANQAQDVCQFIHSSFGEGTCFIIRANAEIGLRRFQHAAQTLKLISKSASRLGDPYLVAATISLPMKLDLAEGRPARSVILPPELELAPKGVRGEVVALQALSAAVAGRHREAMDAASLAQTLTSGVEARYLSRYAELVVRLGTDSPSQVANAALKLFVETAESEVYDAFVLAYRSCKHLLSALVASLDNTADLRCVLTRANDQQLAGEAGIRLASDKSPANRLGSLTPREAQILGLISDGLSNSEIARTLFISENTAKVHVHNVLRKMRVRSRLQAALLARDWKQDSEEPSP